MRSVNPFFITACLSAFLFPPPPGRAAAPAAAPSLPKMETVFDIARPQTQDVIYFRSEDIVQGQLLNEKVSVVTQYGTLSIPLRRCAGLSFEASRANADAVVTVNFNRFTGIVTDHVFRFRIASSGMEVPIRKETIAFVLLKKTAEETDFLKGHDKADLFVMANGDVLSGQTGGADGADSHRLRESPGPVQRDQRSPDADGQRYDRRHYPDQRRDDAGGVGDRRTVPESGNRAESAGHL